MYDHGQMERIIKEAGLWHSLSTNRGTIEYLVLYLSFSRGYIGLCHFLALKPMVLSKDPETLHMARVIMETKFKLDFNS